MGLAGPKTINGTLQNKQGLNIRENIKLDILCYIDNIHTTTLNTKEKTTLSYIDKAFDLG